MRIYNLDINNVNNLAKSIEILFKTTKNVAYCKNSLGKGKYIEYCHDYTDCHHCVLAKRILKTRYYYESIKL